METTVISVRLNGGLLKKAKKHVKAGYYTSLNELMVSGAREEISKHEGFSAAEMVRELRDREWKEALEKAGGNGEKAWKMIMDDARKTGEEFRKKLGIPLLHK
ncbi:MAG: hypothetical protein V1911_02655 [Candidatus Micrarchaeota archaeon]